jgi:replication-associated recombination protein RarA/very-short-patch-repair endonuclease
MKKSDQPPAPLAERMRPATLAEFVGQEHLLGPQGLLTRLIAGGTLPSLILWGEPGTGKTTLARILASTLDYDFVPLSAVTTGVPELRKLLDSARLARQAGLRTLLFVDEIHRWSKSQQDALLHAVEDGTVTLLGATTENPSFEVISPLLSRARVLRFQPLSADHLRVMLHRALQQDTWLNSQSVELTTDGETALLALSGGDGRALYNALELAVNIAPKSPPVHGGTKGGSGSAAAAKELTSAETPPIPPASRGASEFPPVHGGTKGGSGSAATAKELTSAETPPIPPASRGASESSPVHGGTKGGSGSAATAKELTSAETPPIPPASRGASEFPPVHGGTKGGSGDVPSWDRIPTELWERARSMRRQPTAGEKVLWARLRGEQFGTKFRRQHPLGPFIVDFYSPEHQLAIEVDGDTHGEPAKQRYDEERTQTLAEFGIRVKRYSDQDVLHDLDGVIRDLYSELTPPIPPASRGASESPPVHGGTKGGGIRIDHTLIESSVLKRMPIYDKKGDAHYDTISAFIKSVRASDPDAAVYYLARMLAAGEDPLFVARRLIILASEDIGNANPNGLVLAMAGFDAVHALGMPEARIVLAQVTTYLASSPKSNAAYMAIGSALDAVNSEQFPAAVPLHLRNPVTGLMKKEGFGAGYVYPHDHPGHFVEQNHLPPEYTDRIFYDPSDEGREHELKERLKRWWKKRRC